MKLEGKEMLSSSCCFWSDCFMLETETLSKTVGIKILCRHQWHLSLFNQLCRCYLQQQDLAVSLYSSNYCLNDSLGCLGIPMESSANNSIELITVLVPEALFGDKRWSVKISSPPLFVDFIMIEFIYFRTFPLHQVAILLLKCHLILAVSLLIPFLTTFLSPSPPDIFPPPSNSHFTRKTSSIFVSQGDSCVPFFPSSLPNFCRSIDCSFVIIYLVASIYI